MNLDRIAMSLVDEVFERALRENPALVAEVLAYDADSTDVLARDERAFPGNPEFRENGYFRTMLKRYFFAGDYFCAGRDVLDTCCGLGWGSRIIAHYARHLTAFDVDPDVVAWCRRTWSAPNVAWTVADALELRSVRGRFDVVLGMETIEHFDRAGGRRYVAGVSELLGPDGVFIGTSAFPATRAEADALCARNAYHKYVHTFGEMSELLRRHFRRHTIVNGWMFIAEN